MQLGDIEAAKAALRQALTLDPNINRDGHFVGYEPLICYNDDDAIARASALLDTNDIEVWNGPRFIIRLKAGKKAALSLRKSKTDE